MDTPDATTHPTQHPYQTIATTTFTPSAILILSTASVNRILVATVIHHSCCRSYFFDLCRMAHLHVDPQVSEWSLDTLSVRKTPEILFPGIKDGDLIQWHHDPVNYDKPINLPTAQNSTSVSVHQQHNNIPSQANKK
jgi:hypothetical protein